MLRRTVFALLAILIVAPAFSQKLKKADKAVLSNLEAHIKFLSDDKLEGRELEQPGKNWRMII